MKSLLFCCLLLLCFGAEAAALQQIRILGVQSQGEASVSYYHDLLQRVLDDTQTEFGPARIQVIPPPPLGDYRYLLMRQDLIDVHHFGTSIELEQDLQPVRVPLLAGLLGWRGFVIRKADRMAFGQIESFAELKRLRACQGALWPDSEILRASGMALITGERYDQLLELLVRGRCDYFPRSLFEGPVEALTFRTTYPQLMFDTQVLLHYPFPMYFFVRKDNQLLAKRLQLGLDRLARSGQLQQFLQQHPIAHQVFPLSQYARSRVFHLQNPLLPAETPLNVPAYWLAFPATAHQHQVPLPAASAQ